MAAFEGRTDKTPWEGKSPPWAGDLFVVLGRSAGMPGKAVILGLNLQIMGPGKPVLMAE